MFSLSTSKRKAAKKQAQAQQQQPRKHEQQRAATTSGARPQDDLFASDVDELGRFPRGGWSGQSVQDHCPLPLSPPLSTSKLPPPPQPQPRWAFSPTLLPPPPPAAPDEVAWGLIPVRINVVLGIPDLALVAHTLVDQLGQRRLDTPLLFSSLALDVSVPKIKRLIEIYLATLEATPGTSQQQVDFAWAQELAFAGERELGWVLRWALARALQVRPTSVNGSSQAERVTVVEKRGLVDVEQYLVWRRRERASGFPLAHWHAFTAMIGPDLQPVFNDLFALFSRLVAHAHIGGCTPTVIGSLFGPLLFGLPTSSSVSSTQQAFSRAAAATEHLLLAFIRSQSHSSALRAAMLPGRLQAWIAGYPNTLVVDRVLDEGRLRGGVTHIQAEGLRRDVRAYSKELFRNGEDWATEMQRPDGPGRPDVLQTWVERVILPSRRGSALNPTSGPRFTADYKKRLHVPSRLPPLLSSSGGFIAGMHETDGEDVDETERWRSLSEKQWGDFMSSGFDTTSPSASSLGSVEGKDSGGRRATISKQLEFDLTESVRKSHHERRDTMSWSDFSSSGFSRSESMLSETLSFSNPIQRDILEWPEHREEVRRRLKNMQKDLPSFDYNTRPRHVGVMTLEEPFVDFWADILISGGWMDRSDPTLREVNWAIVNYKALPARDATPRRPKLAMHEDPRTDAVYFVFEEIVPVAYQTRLTSPKKTLGLFAPRRSKKSSLGAESLPGKTSHRDKEEEFESSVLRGRPIEMLSLTSRTQHAQPLSALHNPPVSSPASTTFSTPRNDGIRPTRSAGDIKGQSEQRALSPAMQKVTTKKEARRIQGACPCDPGEMDFEMRIASSEPDGTLHRKAVHGKDISRDDLWIDILFSNDGVKSVSKGGGKCFSNDGANSGASNGVAPSIFARPLPPTPAEIAQSEDVAAREADIVVLSPTPFDSVKDEELEYGPDGLILAPQLPLPAADGMLTKSELLLATVAAPQDDSRRNSTASDFTQPDSDLEDSNPRTSEHHDAGAQESEDIFAVLIPPSNYVHGQPLHNLLEEEEED